MATLQMKIDHVHAEFMSGNAVSSGVTTHSIVSRDGNGDVLANKFKSANMELTHNVPASARTSDEVFYSSVDDIIRKNTAAGMISSLGLENSATIAADSGNTGSAIVVRDANGNFSAGVIVASGEALTGLNASNLADGTVSSDRLSLSASDIPNLNADKIDDGTFAAARIPNLNADKIDDGTFAAARIPNLSADKIDDGTFAAARIPNLSADKIDDGTFAAARIPNLSADKIDDGTFATARIPGLDAGKITGGTFDTARIPTLNQDTTGNAATADSATTATSADNADTVDNLEASQFLRSDASDTCSGTLYVSGGAWHHSLGWSAWRALSHGDHIVTSDDTQLQFYVSIRAANYVRSVGMVVTSDERVKTDVQTLDPEIALSKLEKIRPVSYKMKDTGQFTFGFIGQEIEKELPNVVNKGDGTLVDFNMMGEFSNKQSIKYQFEDEEKDVFMYTLTLENPIPSTFDVDKVVAINASSVTGNSSVFLYDPEYCGKPEIGGTVMKLLHETELIEEGKYKIIGTETDDFRSLDYNEIFTVTTAALKEVNEQLKAEKIKTATLETKYEELLKRVEAIEAL
jgi:hypothetical protein